MPYYKYYHYDPSSAAACIFAIVFAITTILHVLLLAKHRTWYFVPVVVGGILEIVGYAARGVSSGQAPHLTLAPFVIETLLLLVAPPLYAATMYMTLGRIIVGVDAEAYSLIKKRWLTKTFVTSDVICFFVQLGGVGLMASSTASTASTGSRIVLAGLLVQIIIFGFFVALAAIFHRRLTAQPTSKSTDPAMPWRKFMLVLYVTSSLILVRNIVRVTEFLEGFDGYIILHEVFLYVFDGVLMAMVSYAFNVWYPSQFAEKARKAAKGDVETVEMHNEALARGEEGN